MTRSFKKRRDLEKQEWKLAVGVALAVMAAAFWATPRVQPQPQQPPKAQQVQPSTARPRRPEVKHKPVSKPQSVDRTSINRIVNIAARDAGVDPKLVHAIIHAESRYNPQAKSEAGAKGLMQLTPIAIRELREKNKFVGDPWDSHDNVRMGIAYYKLLKEYYLQGVTLPEHITKREAALAAYNAGPTLTLVTLRNHGRLPGNKETKDYVRKIMAALGEGS